MRLPTLFPTLIVCSILLGAPAARAGSVTVTIDPAPGQQFASQAGLDLGTLQTLMQTEIENLFQVLHTKEYLQAFTDAQAFTTKGLGVDYASNLKYLEVGIAANVSVNVEDSFKPENARGEPPIGGVGTNATFMAGLNLGLFGLEPVTLFANTFNMKGSYEKFDADFRNTGFHGHLKLFRPTEEVLLGLLHWGGLAITTGLDYSRTRLSLGNTLRSTIPVNEVGGQAAQVVIDSVGTYDLEMKTWSIPLELTTSLRVLYLATVYAGIGIDWQMGGESRLNIDLVGDMVGEIPAQGLSTPLGTARISAAETASPSAGQFRTLIGAQVNLSVLRLFAQLNMVPGSKTVAGVAFGARLAW